MNNQQDNWREKIMNTPIKNSRIWDTLNQEQKDAMVEEFSGLSDKWETVLKTIEQRIREEKDREFEEMFSKHIDSYLIGGELPESEQRIDDLLIEIKDELLSAIKSNKHE